MMKKFATLVMVFVGVVALTTLAFIFLGNNASAEQVAVGQAVAASKQVSMDKIDHAQWDDLIKKYVDEKGGVNYKAWKESSDDSRSLDAYISTLSTASTTAEASKESQLAFWINAYNAVTIKGILREYPTTSIRNHTAKVIGYNIWKDLKLAVGDSHFSLNAIEHEVLRKMDEPRIHFAIVCASHSCPRLLNRAYTAKDLEAQLIGNTQAFFANPENFQYDAARSHFNLSSIIDWFKEDFGTDQAARLRTIAPYLPNREAYDAAIANSVRISYQKYDWSLNEQKEKKKQAQAPSGSGTRQ